MNPSSLTGVLPWMSPFLLVVLLLWLIPILFLVTLQSGKYDPSDIGKAIYSYLLLAVGLLTVLSGVFPLMISLLGMQWLSLESYMTLSVFLLSGSMLMILLCRRMCAVVIPTAAAVSRAIFYCFFFMTGTLLCFGGVLSLLSGALTVLLEGNIYEPQSFWVMPLSLLVTGGGLLLGLRFAHENKFRSLCELPFSTLPGKVQSPSKRSRPHGQKAD